MFEKNSKYIATLAIVVAIGVAIYLGSVLSGIGGAIRGVSEALVSVISSRFGGTTNYDALSVDTTNPTPSDGTVAAVTLAISGASTFTGTTTVTQSVDGLVIGGSNTSIATTSKVVLYENSTGPKHCDSSVGYARIEITGFAPSFIFSLGTTTDGGAPTLNLLASTTVATTSVSVNTTYQLTETAFDLAHGDELVAMFGDITNTSASSTYYGDIESEFGVWCQDSSI